MKSLKEIIKGKESFQYYEVYYYVIKKIEEECGLEEALKAQKFIINYFLFGKDLINYIKELEKGSNDNNDFGYVYIIKVDQYYKIGQTTNLKKRIGEYTKLMKEPKVIINVPCKNYIDIEKELHEMYADKNTNGEWFLLSNEDIKNAVNYLNLRIVESELYSEEQTA